MKNISHWTPVAFCAVLSAIVLGVQLKFGSDSSAWKPAFFCFLPMGFYLVGSTTAQMHKELKELRQRLAALEATKTRP